MGNQLKYFVLIVLFFVGVFVTYKLTFQMTQEVVGSQLIEGHIANYGVNSSILEALEEENYDRAKLLTKTIKANEKEIVRELVISLSNGKFVNFTRAEIEKGKLFLDRVIDSPVQGSESE